jgi:hypothetical protein
VIPALITRLREADYADDRDAMLAEAKALVKTGQFDKVSAGANIYLHLLEHNVSDVTAWGRHRDAIERLYKVVNRGAPTISYNPDGVVLEASRRRLAEFAGIDGTVTVGGREIEVTKMQWATANQALFKVANFLTEAEAARLVTIHDRKVMHEHPMGVTFCDAANGGFEAKIREASGDSDGSSSLEAIRRRHFVPGYNCLLRPEEHAWVARLHWAQETAFYPDDVELVDSVNSRIEHLAALPPHVGHSSQITAYGPGQGTANATGCATGAQYSPRKLNAASAVIVLAAAESGGGEVFARKGARAELATGDLLFTFHFDGQECDLTTNHRTEPVVAGRKVVFTRVFDNVPDQALAIRAMQRLTLDVSGTHHVPYTPSVPSRGRAQGSHQRLASEEAFRGTHRQWRVSTISRR